VNCLRVHEDKTFDANRADDTDDGAILFDPLALGNACLASEDRAELASDRVAERWTRDVAKRTEETRVQH